ncbi:hypothetical protein NUW58_g3078 [Xylaria curta]|uniref:Uncharacterized protein n=1 Tax=Xylaria curta TaxID=42375 RepID=A0ACC1PFC3_9PEZI|nr:hypothetical protein NUW58_g3078 [Xylaria curta]
MSKSTLALIAAASAGAGAAVTAAMYTLRSQSERKLDTASKPLSTTTTTVSTNATSAPVPIPSKQIFAPPNQQHGLSTSAPSGCNTWMSIRWEDSEGATTFTPRRVSVCPDCYHPFVTDVKSPDNPSAAEIVARKPLLNLGSPRAYELVLKSLINCIENHSNCLKPALDKCLPTRVIDCKNPMRPKLFVSKGKTSPYVALSYVWGEKQPYCTQTSNVKRYSTGGIDINVLGQTIRDGIDVTHRLGLRYLWVDALCIIQDSDEDKAKELVKMRNIYRDAYLTIIASSATAASAGFLQTRALAIEYAEHPCLPFYCRDGCVGSMFVYTQESPAMAYDAMKEPVNTRAWCFQERLLSPRKLVYASDTVQYHCQTALADVGNSISSKPIGEQLHDIMFRATDETNITACLSTWTSTDWESLHEIWRMVVSNYTRRSLSNQEDKLLAFAGVAEEFHRIWQERAGRYLAGVWEKRLPDDLLWTRTTRADASPAEDPVRPRLDRSFAPSWSWASVDGHVLPDNTDLNDLDNAGCEVVQCNIALRDTKLPYGHVATASLQLRAVTVPTPWVIFPDVGPETYLSLYMPTDLLRSRMGVADQNSVPIVGTISKENDEGEWSTREVMLDIDRLNGGLLAFDSDMEADSTLLYFMGDISIFFDSSERFPSSQVSAMVVRRFGGGSDLGAKGLLLADAGGGRFRRIAYWLSLMQQVRRGDVECKDPVSPWFDSSQSGVGTRTLELI